ncbi:aminomethyltransferase family protein [Acuticoccus mangrovi]|uniref:Uncharacterized protein n=1 Tax=Acuticoccus mangrovi TaxID=2796142 RepID=A0A934IFJ0_9HYPH|nr:hypothetical protein [Acuticoccus mangrovi]MBJ3775714.1 hypothetical protein [Acuticoccus mangrovi]
MIVPLVSTSPLGGLDLAARDGSIALREAGPFAYLLLRMRQGDKAATAQALGVDLPDPGAGSLARPTRGPARGGDLGLLRCGVDDLLIRTGPARASAVVAEIASALAATPHLLVDLSDALVTMVLSGAAMETALGRVTELDLRMLVPGRVVEATLSGAPARLWCSAPARLEIVAASSDARHIGMALAAAGRPLGLPEGPSEPDIPWHPPGSGPR